MKSLLISDNTMKFKYCPLCGRKLQDKYSWDEGMVPYCPYDKIMYFDTPRPCIMVAVIKNNKILLLKQDYIYKNSKVLISGYIGNGETAEETVIREVFEETGIKISNIKYLGSDYLIQKEIAMFTYVAKYESGEIKKSDEVGWAGWIDLSNALSEMNEDLIGKKVVKKVINDINNYK